MSKIGKRYKRTDELNRSTRAALPSTSLVAIYDKSQREEFAVNQVEFATANPTDGRIPEKESDGTFIDSPMIVTRDGGGIATNVVFDVDPIFPSGSVEIGGQIDRFTGRTQKGVSLLQDAGVSALMKDRIAGSTALVPLTPIDPDLAAPFGVGGTFTLEAPAFVWDSFGGTDTSSVTISGDQKIIVTFTQLVDAYNIAQRVRGTQGKMHYRVIDTTLPPEEEEDEILVYSSEQGSPFDFDSTVPPDNQFEYFTVNPNFLRIGHQLRLEFFSADGEPVTMRGQTIGAIPPEGEGDLVNVFIPYFETLFAPTAKKLIATQEWVGDNYTEEAPSDSKQYTRENGIWVENNSSQTAYSPTGGLTATDAQGAIDELEANKVDDAPNDGMLYSRKSESWVRDNASDTIYDNSSSMLNAVDVQAAIDELKTRQDVFGMMYLSSNATATSGTGLNKIAGTYSAATQNNQFSHASGTLTYTGSKDIDAIVHVDVSCIVNADNFREFMFVCKVNGVTQNQSACTTTSNSDDPAAVSWQTPVTLSNGDFIEVFGEHTGGSSDFTVVEMQISVR